MIAAGSAAAVPMEHLTGNVSSSDWDQILRALTMEEEKGRDRWDEAYDLRCLLIEMPAPHHAALWWKLDTLFGAGSEREAGGSNDVYCGRWMDAVMADARRLLTGGAE